jgi:hypothetical protein
MICLLTAIGLPPGGRSTVHIYTQTIHRTTQNKQYIEQHKHFGRVQAVLRLCELYPGICLTTEEKARKNLSQGRKKHVSVKFMYVFQSNTTLLYKNVITRYIIYFNYIIIIFL